MCAATSLACDFAHTQRNLSAQCFPKVRVLRPHHPFHCPVSWQAVPLLQYPGSVSRLLAWSLLLLVPLLGHWMCSRKLHMELLGCRCKFSELHVLTEIRFLLHHHLYEVPKTAQSFHMLCNLSPPLPLQGWLDVWQVVLQLSLGLRASRDSSRSWCGTGSPDQGSWL